MDQPPKDQPILLDERAVIRRVLRGDRDAYAELVRAHQGRVRGYCRYLLRNESDADDAAQEIFLKAYQSLDRFRGDSSFSTWIYRIAANHCLDRLRSAARRPSQSWDAMIEEHGEKAEALFTTTETPADQAERVELIGAVLAELPERSRQIIVLREVQGLSYDELASTLGCSLDAVKGRLKRARQELDQKLRHFTTPRGVKSGGAQQAGGDEP